MKLLLIKILLFTVPLVLVSRQHGYAQDNYLDNKYDSLASQLKYKKTDKEKIKVLELMIDAGLPRYPDTSFTRFFKDIDQLMRLNKGKGLINIKAYTTLRDGYLLFQKGKLLPALNTLKTSIAEFDRDKRIIPTLLWEIRMLYNSLGLQEDRYTFYTEKLNHYRLNGPWQNTAPCYNGLAGYYGYFTNYNLAISNYLKAADIYKRYSPRDYLYCLNQAGVFYLFWGNTEKAAEYFKIALSLNDGKAPLAQLNALSDLAIDKKDFNLAHRYADEMIKLSGNTSLGRLRTYTIGILRKAKIYIAQGEAEKAWPLIKEAKRTNLTGGNLPDQNYTFYQYYDLVKNYKEAEISLLKAYSRSLQQQINKDQLKYLKDLTEFYGRQNNYKAAFQYNTLFFKLTKDLDSSQNRFKIAQYEGEKKELEQAERISKLDQQRLLQENQLSQRNRMLWIFFVVVLLVSAFLVFIYRQLQTNKKTLSSLRTTQKQLIQSEKMASLGELTAGIAHEIQNPLNFVNNFSEVSLELIEEAKSEKRKAKSERSEELENELLDDISQNLQKISHHGKRADFIVKGMLQHSRTSTGEKQATNINTLADEFLKLSYHGLRAKDKSFNAELLTNFDKNLPKINVVQQDIGRVLLNLFNNAFYAVQEKRKAADPDPQGHDTDYKAVVEVSTATHGDKIEIRVKDNGNGIPDSIKEKIMQPFFTTKPTGEGTGLGLSLSYDIIKAHGGELRVETKEGESSDFIIVLPVNQ